MSRLRKRHPLRSATLICALLALPSACALDAAPENLGEESAASTIPAGSTEITPSLGRGWDSAKQKVLSQCIESPIPRLVGGQTGTALVDSAIDSRTALTALGFDLDAKAHYGLASGSIAASFAQSLQSDDFSKTFIYRSEYVLKSAQLDPNHIELTQLGRNAIALQTWAQSCGDEVVTQVDNGARFFLQFRMDFKNRESKQEADFMFRASSSIGSVKGAISTNREFFAKTASLHIKVYQYGGNPALITGIFSDIPGAHADDPAQNTIKAAMDCSFVNLEACDTFIGRAVAYGTSLEPLVLPSGARVDSFPVQLQSASVQSGPSPTRYVTESWTALAIQPQAPMIVTGALNGARQRLTQTFDKNGRIYRRLLTLRDSGFLTELEFADVSHFIDTMGPNETKILGVVATCYDRIVQRELPDVDPMSDPHFTQSVANCVGAVNGLESGDDRLQIPPEEVLNSYGKEKFLLKKWEELGGGGGFLGYPLEPVKDGPQGGIYRRYNGGIIFWQSTTGARVVEDPIRDALTDDLIQAMKYPTGPAQTASDGTVTQMFQGGYVQYKPSTGAIPMLTVFAQKYNNIGGAGVFGDPVSGVLPGSPDRNPERPGGLIQRYQRGVLYLTPDVGVFTMETDNFNKLQSLPIAKQKQLGHPIADSGTPGIHKRSKLERGVLILKKDTHDSYYMTKELGDVWEQRRPGFAPLGDSQAVAGGDFVRFQDGLIMSKPNLGTFFVINVPPVVATIGDYYTQISGITKCGFPLENVHNNGDRKSQLFERGRIDVDMICPLHGNDHCITDTCHP